MPNGQMMTLDEKYDVARRAFALLDAGDREGYDRVLKTAPLPPYLAKVIKEKVGLDALLSLGWNLSEVEAKYGSAWLSQ